MRICTKGVTRIVIILDTVVVKVPNFTHKWNHFLKGIIGNIEEHNTWRYNTGDFDTGNSHLLCPVVWCSWLGFILIMKKAEPLSTEQWEAITDISEHKLHFPGDDTISNYGYYCGRLVKIDYGGLDVWGSDYRSLLRK